MESLPFYSNDPGAGKRLAEAVAIGANTIVAGAINDSQAHTLAGAAYVFDADTGVQRFKLFANDAQPLDGLGSSVAISNTTAAIGRNRVASPAFGAVYLFDTVSGQQISKIEPLVPQESEGFGHAVALNSSYLAVGAPFYDGPRANSGAVYVFDVMTGVQLYMFEPLPHLNTAWFGYSVALEGSTLVIGSPRQTPNRGAIHLIDLTNGTEIVRIEPSDPSIFDERFGHSVAIDAARIAVGSPMNLGNGNSEGAVYLYDRLTRNETKLVGYSSNEKFGWSIALEGPNLVAGAPDFTQSSFSGTGRAYVFDLNIGVRRSQLLPLGARSLTPPSQIGYSVGIDSKTAVVGAPGTIHSSLNANAGAAYTFVTGECWQSDERSGSFGPLGFPLLHGRGALSSGNSFTLRLNHAPLNAPTLLIAGLGESLVPFGLGTLYPTLDLVLTGYMTNPAGELVFSAQYPIGVMPVPLYFQTWTFHQPSPGNLVGSRGVKGQVF